MDIFINSRNKLTLIYHFHTKMTRLLIKFKLTECFESPEYLNAILEESLKDLLKSG